MKTILVRFCMLALAVTTAGSAFAQSFAVINKEARYQQTSATAVSAHPDGAFRFEVDIEGTANEPAPPNTVTLPNNAGTRTLVFAIDDGWTFQESFSSQAALDARYPSGTYRITAGGVSVNLPFSGDLYPAAPVVSVSGGTFSNGVLRVDRAAPVTFTINYSQNFVPGSSRLAISRETRSTPPGAQSVALSANTDESGFTRNQLSLTVPANRFAAGACTRSTRKPIVWPRSTRRPCRASPWSRRTAAR